MSRVLGLAVLGCGMLLAGCHGSTLDAIYLGSLGHTPPPVIDLPISDCPVAPGSCEDVPPASP